MKVADFALPERLPARRSPCSLPSVLSIIFPEQARAVTVMQEAIFIRLVLLFHVQSGKPGGTF